MNKTPAVILKESNKFIFKISVRTNLAPTKNVKPLKNKIEKDRTKSEIEKLSGLLEA